MIYIFHIGVLISGAGNCDARHRNSQKAQDDLDPSCAAAYCLLVWLPDVRASPLGTWSIQLSRRGPVTCHNAGIPCFLPTYFNVGAHGIPEHLLEVLNWRPWRPTEEEEDVQAMRVQMAVPWRRHMQPVECQPRARLVVFR